MSLPLLLILALLSPLGNKQLMYDNRVYEKEIRTVKVFGHRQTEGDQLLSAVAPLGQNDLVLQFDDLRNDFNRYYAKVIHCHYDWSPSTLRDLDYLMDYNEFPILDYSFSNNTLLPYVHYEIALPQVKIPGNYLVLVYRDGDTSDIILTHRFMIYDTRTSISQSSQRTSN
jgi:Domain of unknown function (DUF5103)